MTATDELLQNNDAYVQSFDAGGRPAEPAKKVAVVTCMDARLDPARALGLTTGDAHVIRNAGGAVTDDVIRSLAISQHLLGTEEIVVIHHTKCGMRSFTDDEFAERLEKHAGEQPPFRARTFDDPEENLRAALSALKKSPFLVKRDVVRGFVYDVDTGRLTELSS